MPGPDFEQEFIEGLRTIGADGTKRPPPVTAPDPTENIETVGTVTESASSGAPVLLTKVTPQNVFRHPDTHPIVLDLLLINKYGPEWMGWSPETLELRIPGDFKTPSLSELNFSKILAVSTLHLVDTFWQRWEIFNWCAMTFNGVLPNFEVMQVPTVAQVLVAVDIANRVRTDMDWTQEVKAFISTVYRHDDIFLPIPPADFVKIDVEGYDINVVEIAKQWPEVRASGKAPSDESVTAEQLRRLLLVHTFLEESRSQLRQQLTMVGNV
jgi:hypothetical protein